MKKHFFSDYDPLFILRSCLYYKLYLIKEKIIFPSNFQETLHWKLESPRFNVRCANLPPFANSMSPCCHRQILKPFMLMTVLIPKQQLSVAAAALQSKNLFCLNCKINVAERCWIVPSAEWLCRLLPPLLTECKD